MEKGSIHRAESCINGVMTVLEADVNAHNVQRYAVKWKKPPTPARASRVELRDIGTVIRLQAAAVMSATKPLIKAFCSGVRRSRSSLAPSSDQSKAGTSGTSCVHGRSRGEFTLLKGLAGSSEILSLSGLGRRRRRLLFRSGVGGDGSTSSTAAGGRMQASQMTSLTAQQQVAATVCHSHAKDRCESMSAASMLKTSRAKGRTIAQFKSCHAGRSFQHGR